MAETPAAGLSEAEAAARLQAREKLPSQSTSRSYTSIIRANTLTIPNGILLLFALQYWLFYVFNDWNNLHESNGVLAFFVLAIGTALTLLGLGLVQAASARALAEIDAERSIGPLRAYRLAVDSVAPLFGALLLAAVVISLLASSLYLIPIAIWLAGRWALIAPAIELEDLSATGGLRRSGRLVRRRWLKASSLIVAGAALAILLGPLVGVLLILGTDAPFWLVNVVAGVIYSVTMPFVALTTTYVYFDARVRSELAGERVSAQLPAEIEVST